MSDIVLANQVPSATPNSGTSVMYADSVSKQFAAKNDTGRVWTLGGIITNWNTADVSLPSVDTYITGSNLSIPTHLMQVGTTFKWTFYLTKTGAGTAAPIWVVRIGTLGALGDAAILTFTQVALQTANADAARVDIVAVLRNTGAAGILAGGLSMTHVLATTGFSTLGANVQQVTSSGFVTTTSGLIVGVSANPGASGVWTIQTVTAEAVNL